MGSHCMVIGMWEITGKPEEKKSMSTRERLKTAHRKSGPNLGLSNCEMTEPNVEPTSLS